jgi:GT2 family glycosyltransferase
MNLSIIIVSYNTENLTVKCLRSIFESKLSLSYEIVVVDNASKDNSIKSVESLFKKHPRVRTTLIRNSENLGFAKANNQGVRVAKGEYILLLNSDTLVTSGQIETLYDFATQHPDAGIVAPQLMNANGTIQPSVYYLPTITRAIREFWLRGKKFFSKYAPSSYEAVSVESVVAAAFLITPQARQHVGLLDERYFMYFEDLDYCRRTLAAGLRIYYVPQSQIIHFHGASGKDLAKQNDQWKRLIPSSKLYHGYLAHTLITFILWSGQKLFGHS